MMEKRSFLTSWKLFFAVEILAVLFIISFTCMLYISSQPKKITFVANGQMREAETKAKTVGEFLREQSIHMDEYDQLAPAQNAPIKDGLTITYNDRWRVPIQDGQTVKRVVTSKKTVAEILQEQGISLGKWDKVAPRPDDFVEPNQMIAITRVEKNWIEEETEIPYHEIKKKDYTLAEGQKKVVQEGKPGKALLRYEVHMENGREVSRKLLDTETLVSKQDKIVAVGAMMTVSRGGKSFQPRKVIENVKLTAYAAGASHTGKGPDHPQYAITATGTRAQEGRTIAVDPRVIPLGSWVYIEGYGFRRAEDTGSAVKNNKIDIYFEDESKASSFGVKRSPKVYVIGPQQPR